MDRRQLKLLTISHVIISSLLLALLALFTDGQPVYAHLDHGLYQL